MGNIIYNKQFLDHKDILSVKKSLLQSKITTGPLVETFEKKIKNFLKSKYALTCSSGTAAIDLCFKAIDLKKGDIVIMPVINFISAYSMAKQYGAKIFFADVDMYTGQMTKETIMDCVKKNKLKNIKALLVMYLGGYVYNNFELYKIKKKLKCKLIEDACHAFGSEYNFNSKTYKIGSCKHADLSAFSFHPLKTITTGEGGAVSTNNRNYYNTILKLRSHGISRKKDYWNYDIKYLSNNYRLSDINCALGISQLKKINIILDKRKKLYKKYLTKFKNNQYVKILQYLSSNTPSFHLIIFNFNFKKLKSNKEKLIKFMIKNKIFPQFHYIPIYKFSFFRKNKIKYNFVGAENYYKSTLSFPLYFKMNYRDIDKINIVVQKFINKQNN